MENLLKVKKTTPSEISTPATYQPTVKPADFVAQKYVHTVKKELPRRKMRVKSLQKPSFSSIERSQKYLSHLPMLLLSFVGYAAAFFIFTHVDPSSIQNILIPNTYLPLLVLLAEGHFFFFSFVLMNSRRGLEVMLILTLFIFLKLQGVLTAVAGGIVVVPFLLIEVIASLSPQKDL